MLITVVLFGLVLVATFTDVARHKIYNWTTYSGMLMAVALSAGGSLAVAAGIREEPLESLGWIPLAESLGGLAVCGFVMLVCFVMFNVGGGDVKLIAMLGAFLGPEQGITAMLWTFVLGGCVGLIVLVWRVGPMRLVVRVLRQILWSLRIGAWSPLTQIERAQLRPPLFLAPTALLAVAIVRLSLDQYLLPR
jgi:prepilin peptidase CpaA